MNRMVATERDLSVDIESGGTTSGEEGWRDSVSGVGHTRMLFGRVGSGFMSFDGSVKHEDGVSSCDSLLSSAEVSIENVELLADKMSRGEENVDMTGREMPKKKMCKKPPKPPRPQKSPVLDAADQKLVREISELAILKRARNERKKALKKMKATKASSSSSNLCAMAITILFLLVIILQGVFSRRSSNANLQGSPESAVATRGGLISVQYYGNMSRSVTNGASSGSPKAGFQVRQPGKGE